MRKAARVSSFRLGDAELHDICGVVREHNMRALMTGEIDHNVGTFGRRNSQLPQFNRCRKKALVGANLHHRQAISQLQMVKAASLIH